MNNNLRVKVFAGICLSLVSCGVWAEEFSVPHGVAHIDWRSEFSSDEQSFLKRWLAKATHTASQLAGKFPRAESRIVIERSRRRGSRWPVPWGQTMRSGTEGVLFQVNTSKSMDEFVGDWTAAHEFSHLFIPYPGQRDIWLSEGFASYYQNILMAREGLYSEHTAWQKLYEGFVRAEADRNPTKTLDEVSQGRRRYNATMRIYWSGALIFLEADIALRTKTENRLSLDWVLDQYMQCCRHQRDNWNGEQLMASFDEILSPELKQESFFTDLYQRYSNSLSIPDCRPLLAQLGITIEDEQISFTDDADLAALREDFTRARIEPLAIN